MKWVLMIFVLGLSGCLSIPTSRTPQFYTLSAAGDPASQKLKIASDVIIGVGPIKIPNYLDRPQIVTRDKNKMLQFAQFDRWGEALDTGLARLIREDLTIMLPQAKLTLYPWNPSIAVKYQVVVEIVQLDSELDQNMDLVVQWTIIDVQNSKALVIKRSEFHQPIIPQNYLGLTQMLSTACASLSSQIAEALASF